jgi:hypothetical protein
LISEIFFFFNTEREIQAFFEYEFRVLYQNFITYEY